MKLSYKALLYSVLVFPGSGYFVVKESMKGGVSVAISLSCLSVFIIEAFHKSQIIAEKIVSGLLPYDIAVIREQITITEGYYPSEVIVIASTVFVLVWVIGIIDSFRIGRKLDKQANGDI